MIGRVIRMNGWLLGFRIVECGFVIRWCGGLWLLDLETGKAANCRISLFFPYLEP